MSQSKCNDSGVLILHHDNDVKVVVSSQPSIKWYKSANQKIGVRTVHERIENKRRLQTLSIDNAWPNKNFL